MLRLISRLIIGLLAVLILLIGGAIMMGQRLPREIEIVMIAQNILEPDAVTWLALERHLHVTLALPGNYDLFMSVSQRDQIGLMQRDDHDRYYTLTSRGVIPYPLPLSVKSVVWLADGSTLQVVENKGNPDRYNVYQVTPDGIRTLWFSHPAINRLFPSPDGRWVLIHGQTFNQGFTGYLYDRATRTITPFDPNPYIAIDQVAWSLDSRWIAAISPSETPTPGILIRHVLTPYPERLASYNFSVAYAPSWSPDPTQIAYAISFETFISNRDRSERRKLDLGFPLLDYPIWLPDGRLLLTADGPEMLLLLIDPAQPEVSSQVVRRGLWTQVLVMP